MDPTDITLAIAHRLAQVRADIADTAQKAGRMAGDVRLIAVSKTQPAAYVAAAVQAGQRDFGENTLQDALTKIPQFAGLGLNWHFIGHLQSNKAKLVPGHFHWLHSLESASLARRLSQRAQEVGVVLNALIEVNITRDPRRHGVTPDAVFALLEELVSASLPGLALRGLMAMGPYPADAKSLRTAFSATRQLRDVCAQRYALPDFTELSMGMSGDYAAAIQEGSTMVRIGTAIFGERDYLK